MAHWRPDRDATITAHFIDVLQDNEDSDLDQYEEGVMADDENDEELDITNDEELDITEMPVLVQLEDGSLCNVDTYAASITDSDSGEEILEEYRQVQSQISPLTSPQRTWTPSPIWSQPPSPPRLRIEVDVKESPAAPARRGALANRGRGRGGRRRGKGGRAGRGRRLDGWERGQPLSEMFVLNEDLPLQLREEISRVLAGRSARSRRTGVRMAGDVINEDINDDDVVEDEFYDCDEAFIWRPASEFRSMKEEFVPQECGPTRLIANAYDALHSIWDDNIMSYIAKRSNAYAETVTSARFHRDWFSTNISEIWCLFAFWIMLGIIKMPSIKSCFTRMPLLRTEVFRLLFTETRYWNLNKALHFSEGNDASNLLHPMGPLIDHLNGKFQELYRLHQEIRIDESLTLWRGPCGMKQYIRTKSARWGIKSFQLCESATGYLWSFFIYCGKARAAAVIPSSASTVLKLIRPILNLGHTLYMDNWFNSPTLARWLKRKRTDCVGTLRASWMHVPLEIARCPLAEGQFIARSSDEVMVAATHDRKRVTLLSTFHDVTQIKTEPRPGRPQHYKLKLVDDYNRGMGGVDMMDQMLEAYLLERKQCLNWAKKLFKRLLNVSIQNARIIVEKSTNQKLDSMAFRLALVQEIIDRHLSNSPRPPASVRNSRYPGFPLGRLTERHFIRRIQITQEMRDNASHRFVGRARCVWCTRNQLNKKTCYECEQCKMPLCLDNCFQAFHTQS